MSNEKALDVLYTLIKANNYRMESYKTASKEIIETGLKTLFSEFAKTSKNCKAELATAVRKLGGTFIDETQTTGRFFQAWMNVKVGVISKDRRTIINLCEEGEVIALESYDRILRNYLGDITSEQHAIIVEQQSLIRADCVKLKSLHEDAVLEHH
jgi:uncharacterized protein (TIGR02284 family)